MAVDYESAYGNPDDAWGNFGNALQNFAPGALQGAGIGATIGSVIPGLGTAIGAGAGALIGGLGSYFAGNQEIEARRQQEQMQQDYLQNQQALQDAAFAQQRRALQQMYGGQQGAIAQQYAQQAPGLRAALASRGMLGTGAEAAAQGGLAGKRAQSLAEAQQANILGQSNIATNQTAAQMRNQALATQMMMANRADAAKMYSDRLKSTMSAAGGLASSLMAPQVSDAIKSAFSSNSTPFTSKGGLSMSFNDTGLNLDNPVSAAGGPEAYMKLLESRESIKKPNKWDFYPRVTGLPSFTGA